MSVLLLLGVDVCFLFAQDSDAAAAIHISDPRSCFTQKAEGCCCCCCGRSSQCAQQSSVNGYAFLDCFILLKTRCNSWCDALNASPRGAMGEEWNLSQSLLGRTNWPAVLVYVLCLSLCFLSQHARPDLPVVDVWSAAISFDIFPPPAVDRWNPKLPLTWGSAMGSLSVCSVPLLFLLPSPRPIHFSHNLPGVQEELRETKPKAEEDALGLVPYDGDSSDEEEERTLCSKADSRSWLLAVVSPPPRIPALTRTRLLKSASSSLVPFSDSVKKKNPFCIVLMKMPVCHILYSSFQRIEFLTFVWWSLQTGQHPSTPPPSPFPTPH